MNHTLPAEVLLNILAVIPYNKGTLQALSLTCGAFAHALRRRLFHTLHISNIDAAEQLAGLVSTPHVFYHVRTLGLNPMVRTLSDIFEFRVLLLSNLTHLKLQHIDFSDLDGNTSKCNTRMTSIELTECVDVTHILRILPPLEELVIISATQRSHIVATVQCKHLTFCPETMSIFGEGRIVSSSPYLHTVEIRAWCPYTFFDTYEDTTPHPVYDRGRNTRFIVSLTWEEDLLELDRLDDVQELHILCDLDSIWPPQLLAQQLRPLDELQRLDLYLKFKSGFAIPTFHLFIEAFEELLQFSYYLGSLEVVNVIVGPFRLRTDVDSYAQLKQAKEEMEKLFQDCAEELKELHVWWDREFLEDNVLSSADTDIASWKHWSQEEYDRVFVRGEI